jgi:hypothetical protein
MNEADEKEAPRSFKVDDRRRFSDTGEARPLEPAAAPEPDPPARPDRAPAEPSPLDINFSTFVISLSTQVLVHLGEIPNPIDAQTAVDLGAAKQLIDILGVLKDKTRGNLDASESSLLEGILYDLRLRYVERVRVRPAGA